MVWIAMTVIIGLVCLWCSGWYSGQTKGSSYAQLLQTEQTVTGTVTGSGEGQRYLWLRVLPAQGQTLQPGELLYVTIPPMATEKATVSTDLSAEATKAPYSTDPSSATIVWYPPGSTITVQGVLREPQGQRNPGGFDERQWLQSKQVRYKLLADTITVIEPPKGVWAMARRVHHQMKAMAETHLAPEESALALALLLGEKQRLEPAFYRLTQRMGIAHMFAVSGLHVGFVAGLFLLLLRLWGWDRCWISWFVLLLGLSFYCVLTGLAPSALRATVMILLTALALRLQRPGSGIDFLATAALVLLLYNPFLLWTAGFQLSFGVTLSLLLFVAPLQQRLYWIGWPWLRASVSVTVAAYLGSLPLSAWHFYSVSLLAPLFNLLLVPVVSLLVPLLLISFALTALLPIGGGFFFYPVHVLSQLLLQGPVLLEQLMGSGQWNIGRPGWLALCCYLVFLLALWYILRGTGMMGTRRWLLLTVLLCSTVWLCAPRPPAADTLLYLDTGQGSCALLRTRAGETVILDGGAQQGELASCLAWYGVNRVHAILLSHGDTDHISGIAQVLERMPVTYLCMEAQELEAQGAQRQSMAQLLALARQQRTSIKAMDAPMVLRLQQGSIQLAVYQDGGTGSNSRELTALLRMGSDAVAFPGDLSVEGAAAFVNDQQRITIWTVPHHGSRGSASAALYRQLKQRGVQRAVISAGKDNGYGHPHGEVLQYLQQNQIPWQRTDEQNAIRIELDSGKKISAK